MDFDDLVSFAEEQERGAWLDVPDPMTGEPSGMRFLVCGPDSPTQKRAKMQHMDDLVAMAGPDGICSAENREAARRAMLARCVKDFDVTKGGAKLAFDHKMMVRILETSSWVDLCIDRFADDRAAYRPK
jgi:hypothetical protein